MNLTDTRIKGLKPTDKVYRVGDGKEKGLSLEIRPTGSKIWRFRYTKSDGKQTMISLGEYPAVSLASARGKAKDKRHLLAQGVNISSTNLDGTFGALFEEWFKNREPQWTAGHAETVKQRIEANILPYLGKQMVSEITGVMLLGTVERIQERGAMEVARRVLQICGQVFTFAIAKRYCETNPAVGLKDALKPVIHRSYPAPTAPGDVSRILQAIDVYQGSHVTRCALKLLPMTMLRPGEFRKGEWSEIDFDAKTWTVPGSKMKLKSGDHVVPLSRQAISILEELKLLTGDKAYIFEGNRRGRPMSENTLVAALRGLGFEKGFIVAHSFRTIASTMLNERNWPADWIERQLHHIPGNRIRGIYNRALYLPQRRIMLQAWCDFMDYLRAGGSSIEELREGRELVLVANS